MPKITPVLIIAINEALEGDTSLNRRFAVQPYGKKRANSIYYKLSVKTFDELLKIVKSDLEKEQIFTIL
ncbi:hypothetical protein QTP88_017859 [Uroleucon formosanum]